MRVVHIFKVVAANQAGGTHGCAAHPVRCSPLMRENKPPIRNANSTPVFQAGINTARSSMCWAMFSISPCLKLKSMPDGRKGRTASMTIVWICISRLCSGSTGLPERITSRPGNGTLSNPTARTRSHSTRCPASRTGSGSGWPGVSHSSPQRSRLAISVCRHPLCRRLYVSDPSLSMSNGLCAYYRSSRNWLRKPRLSPRDEAVVR